MTAKIKLNAASGGGSVSIQAPSSSSNNRVISLPDIADGTLLTTQSTGLGIVLQVVESGFTSSFQTASTSFVDITSASVTITPSSSSNKILVMANLNTDYVAQTSDLRVIYTKLLRGSSTEIDKKAYYLGHDVSSTGYSFYGTPIDMFALDSPAVNTAVTYKVQAKTDSGNNNALFRVNMVSGSGASKLIAMEVAA